MYQRKTRAVFDGKKDLKFINQEGLTSFKKYLKKKYHLQEVAIIFEPTGIYSQYIDSHAFTGVVLTLTDYYLSRFTGNLLSSPP
jgi:hypothetical protein